MWQRGSVVASTTTLIFDVLARDHTSKTLDKVSRKVDGLKSTAKTVGAAFAAAGATAFAKGAIEQARESIKVQKQSEAVLKSTGGQAGVTASHIENLANKLSNLAGVDDELIQSGENVLLTFTKIRNQAGRNNDIFDQATGLALDMSKALGTDLQGSIIQVGKALNDPIKGVTALRRVGVSFTKAQQDQIKTLVETGDLLGAQKLILGELRTEFGGSAKAQATDADRMKVAWENLQETLGKKLIPVMEKVASFIVKHQKLILPLAAVIGTVLVAAFIAWAHAAVVAAGAAISSMASAAAAAAATALSFVIAFAPVIAIGAAVALLALVVIKNWDTIKSAIGAAIGFIQGLIGGLIETFRKIPGWIADAMKGLANIITAPYRAAFNAIARLWNSTVGKLSFKIPGWVPGIGGKGFDVPNIPTVKALAEGGIVTSPTLALIGEAGPEAVIPLGKMSRGAAFGDINVDARGITEPATVGDLTSRMIAWRLGLVGGI